MVGYCTSTQSPLDACQQRAATGVCNPLACSSRPPPLVSYLVKASGVLLSDLIRTPRTNKFVAAAYVFLDPFIFIMSHFLLFFASSTERHRPRHWPQDNREDRRIPQDGQDADTGGFQACCAFLAETRGLQSMTFLLMLLAFLERRACSLVSFVLICLPFASALPLASALYVQAAGIFSRIPPCP